MVSRSAVVTLLLFGSGLCALAYQACWFRMLRLVFGASTLAHAAVLAIFMGALGLGSAVLGGRAEKHDNPLRLYGQLELGVAAGAALTPWLVDLVRAIYLGMGGSMQLGNGGALLARLVLSAVALGVPVFLAGGTLPAAARVAVTPGDSARRQLAVVYGINTLGAVVGCVLPVFVLFEETGVRGTLLLCAAFNGLLGVVALWWSEREDAPAREAIAPVALEVAPPDGIGMPRALALWVAFVTGFIFLMGELVWYRLAAPLLGGSTYTFGVVLGVALLGVGLGGLLYALAPPSRPHVMHLALSCALEGLALGLPLAAGDHLADVARFARAWGETDFGLLTAGWVGVAALLVFPAALVSGYQFPLLVALVGRGRDGVARDVGAAYAANTLGSISGSLLGGFVLLPVLGAVVLWQVSVLLLVVTGVVLLLSGLRAPRWPVMGLALLAAYAGGMTATATGPTAYWRHRPIGAGRAALPPDQWNARQEARRWASRTVLRELDGVESSLAFQAATGWSLLTNGKSDGHVFADAPTQVGLGMLPAALLTARGTPPQRAFVIGLGTGQTAGWLSVLPGMQQVDVAELEPGVVAFAALAKETNHAVLERPNVRMLDGDGRELLMTAPGKYDLVVSEPSNPYRAGVASLYSHEFYQMARTRLTPNGVFVQWLQSYDLDVVGVRAVVATLRASFDNVTVWSTQPRDMVLLASNTPLPVHVDQLTALLAQPVFSTALGSIMGIWSGADVVSRLLANEDLANAWQRSGTRLNTDDHPILEFEFARQLGSHGDSVAAQVALSAHARGWTTPRHLVGRVDAAAAEDQRLFHLAVPPPALTAVAKADPWLAARWVVSALEGGRPVEAAQAAVAALPAGHKDRHPEVLLVEAELLARAPPDQTAARARLEDVLATLEARGLGTTVLALRLVAAVTAGDRAAVTAVVPVLVARLRVDPWVRQDVAQRALVMAGQTADQHVAPVLLRALLEGPLLAFGMEQARRDICRHLLLGFAQQGPPPPWCGDVLRMDEDAPVWTQQALELRARCYQAHVPALAAAATADLRMFRAHQATPVEATLPAPAGGSP